MRGPSLHKVATAPHVENLPSPARPGHRSVAIVPLIIAPADEQNQDRHFLILLQSFANS